MKAYAVVENCQEGLEAEAGYAKILGIFLIDPKNKQLALKKAEKCMNDRYTDAVVEMLEGETEQENGPELNADGMLAASWVASGNDTAHFLDVREVDITQ